MAMAQNMNVGSEDFPAIVVQHEMDHLEGITLLEHSSVL